MVSRNRPASPDGTKTVVLLSALLVILVTSLIAAGCGGGTSGTTTTGAGTATTAGAGGTQVVLKGFAFAPASVTVKVGDTVTWTNQDSAAHDVTADNGEFASGNMGNGATFSFAFDKAGTYPYHCAIHPNMTGTVVVQ